MEWEIRNWLLVPMYELCKYLLILNSEFAAISNYICMYCLPKIQLLPIIHLNHNSLLLYESSFASKKWSFQFMIDIKMAILINSSL